ncbi:MAG: sigma-54-dependent Fis family transcriptional regulator [Gammaproteobacteria bacterium]
MSSSAIERTRRQSARRYRAEVERAWDAMTTTGELTDGRLREHVGASWRRCLAAGVLPATQLPRTVGGSTGLAERHAGNRELMLAAENTWRLLADILSDTHSVLIVADADGVVLDVAGNHEVVDRGRELYVAPGFDWSENGAGTNAVGTAIATGQPAEIDSVEHFCAVAKVWNCAAAPVRDTVDGTLVGVIDITTFGDAWHGHGLALAVTTAHQIEQTLQSRDLARNVQLLKWYQANLPRWSNHALLLLDRKGRIVTSNNHAQSLFRDRQLVERMVRGAALLSVDDARSIEDQLVALPHDLRAHALETYGRADGFEGGILVLDAVHSIGAKRGARRASEPPWKHAFRGIIGHSPGIEKLKARAARMARSTAPVLILGETGTGKELVARAVHNASPQAEGPFVAVNCGTLTPELAASQLLGYEPGAFTGAAPRGAAGQFEQADGGTRFRDEVGELPPDVQVNLLRVLQDNIVVRVGGHRERAVDVRVVAATNRDLEAAVSAGQFREDLYFRLCVLALELPPLRSRTGDIPLLAEATIAELNERYGFGPKRLGAELVAFLEQQPWPGNVRQLRAVVESMYVMAEGDRLTLADLPDEMITSDGTAASAAAAVPAAALFAPPLKTMANLERDAILAHLEACHGNRSQVARALGISRSTLYRKLADYGIG